MTWEQHNALCIRGDLAALTAQLERESDPIEREVFYVSTINMTYRQHPQITVTIGVRYIDEFYQAPKPVGPETPPNGDILKRLVLLLDPSQFEDEDENKGNRELAIWICKFALAFGVSDGTKADSSAALITWKKHPIPEFVSSSRFKSPDPLGAISL